MDLAKITTDELKRRFRRLDADTSTTSMAQEARRMFALQEITSELARRGGLEAA